MTTLQTDQVTALIEAFNRALACTPPDMPLLERTRWALHGLPIRVVEEIGQAADELAAEAQDCIGRRQ